MLPEYSPPPPPLYTKLNQVFPHGSYFLEDDWLFYFSYVYLSLQKTRKVRSSYSVVLSIYLVSARNDGQMVVA